MGRALFGSPLAFVQLRCHASKGAKELSRKALQWRLQGLELHRPPPRKREGGLRSEKRPTAARKGQETIKRLAQMNCHFTAAEVGDLAASGRRGYDQP